MGAGQGAPRRQGAQGAGLAQVTLDAVAQRLDQGAGGGVGLGQGRREGCLLAEGEELGGEIITTEAGRQARGQVLERDVRAGEDPDVPDSGGLAAVDAVQGLLDGLGQAALLEQSELAVEDHPRGATGDGRRRAVQADAALHPDWPVGDPDEALQEDVGAVLTHAPAALRALGDEAVHLKGERPLGLAGARDLHEDAPAPKGRGIRAGRQHHRAAGLGQLRRLDALGDAHPEGAPARRQRVEGSLRGLGIAAEVQDRQRPGLLQGSTEDRVGSLEGGDADDQLLPRRHAPLSASAGGRPDVGSDPPRAQRCQPREATTPRPSDRFRGRVTSRWLLARRAQLRVVEEGLGALVLLGRQLDLEAHQPR